MCSGAYKGEWMYEKKVRRSCWRRGRAGEGLAAVAAESGGIPSGLFSSIPAMTDDLTRRGSGHPMLTIDVLQRSRARSRVSLHTLTAHRCILYSLTLFTERDAKSMAKRTPRPATGLKRLAGDTITGADGNGRSPRISPVSARLISHARAEDSQESLELLAAELVTVRVKVEKVGRERQRTRLVSLVVVRLHVRVRETLLDRVALAWID